jgi:transcriptional regulatory protein LevR
VDIKKLWRMLPVAIKSINEQVKPMSIDTEIGLLVHIACSINRIAGKENIPTNIRKEQIIKSHGVHYRQVRKIIKPCERTFGIIIPDDEIANIIMIINKL